MVLDDPSRRNTMGMAMYAAVPALVAEVNGDPHARALVVRGEGTAFSAGSDITEFRAQRLGDAHVHYDEVEHRATEALASCRVPVVAAIRGACMGGGLSIALAADLRYAASDTLFSVPPGRLGVGYPLDAIDRLVAPIGRAAAPPPRRARVAAAAWALPVCSRCAPGVLLACSWRAPGVLLA